MREELSKKSAKLLDDYINGRQELSLPIYNKLKGQLNLCIQELQDLVWNRTCDPSQYDKLAKRSKDYIDTELLPFFICTQFCSNNISLHFTASEPLNSGKHGPLMTLL